MTSRRCNCQKNPVWLCFFVSDIVVKSEGVKQRQVKGITVRESMRGREKESSQRGKSGEKEKEKWGGLSLS